MGRFTTGMALPLQPYKGFTLCYLLYSFLVLFLLRGFGFDYDPNVALLWWLQVTGPVVLQGFRLSILRVALFLT